VKIEGVEAAKGGLDEGVGVPVVVKEVRVIATLALEQVLTPAASDLVFAFRADERIGALGADQNLRERRAGNEQHRDQGERRRM
jgi:hypothetical protein